MWKDMDYIPKSDEGFDILQNNVYTTASTKTTQWLIPSQVINELNVLRQRWTTAYAITRPRHLLEYKDEDLGKNVWYAGQWVNSARKGPWSEIASALIP
jgi:SLT domain-containing protein